MKLNVKEADANTLRGIVDTVEQELQRRKDWPTRVVYRVPGIGGMERFYDLDEALKAFRRWLVDSMRTAGEWQRKPDGYGNEVKMSWCVESYEPGTVPGSAEFATAAQLVAARK